MRPCRVPHDARGPSLGMLVATPGSPAAPPSSSPVSSSRPRRPGECEMPSRESARAEATNRPSINGSSAAHRMDANSQDSKRLTPPSSEKVLRACARRLNSCACCIQSCARCMNSCRERLRLVKVGTTSCAPDMQSSRERSNSCHNGLRSSARCLNSCRERTQGVTSAMN